jgi:hypothetical protein
MLVVTSVKRHKNKTQQISNPPSVKSDNILHERPNPILLIPWAQYTQIEA